MSVVVVDSNVFQIIERNSIFVFLVVIQNVIAQIHIDIFVVIEHQIIVFGLRLFLLGFGRHGILGIGCNHPALAVLHLNHVTCVGADDRCFVQVVKAFASGRANAFRTPFFVGHVKSPYINLMSLVDDSCDVPYEGCTVKGNRQFQGTDMGNTVLKGNPDIPLTLRRSARARRISLRISQLDGRVTLTLPEGVPESEAIDFARTKQDWIASHLAKQPKYEPLGFGSEIMLSGNLYTITQATGKRITVQDRDIAVPGAPEQVAARLKGFLRSTARERLTSASDDYAQALGKPYTRISIRDTRSRWGSCSSEGVLMYSWRLIMAPPEVLDYVVAHEVAHLSEMNHSKAFWDTVERIYGPYKGPRKWLRDNGTSLHRFQF